MILLGAICVLVLLEVAVNVLFGPQEGPPALAAVFEPHLLAVGFVAAVVVIVATLADRGTRATRLRVVAVAMIVVSLVRLGGEWWSPPVEEPAPTVAPVGDEPLPLTVLSWNLELGSKPAATTLAGIFGVGPEPDLIALQELTPSAAAAIEAEAALTATYPYRILEAREGVDGMGLLSRYPLVVGSFTTGPLVLRASLVLPDGSQVEVFDVHPYPPRIRTAADIPWGLDTRARDADLAVIAALVAGAPDPDRVLVIGDLNTTPFEPGFAIVREGLLDAHAEAASGPGFTWRPSSIEPLRAGVLRIDHVLSGADLLPIAAREDCGLPGDHCRLFVTLEVVLATGG